LGLVYERRNRFAQAEPLLKRSIVIAEKHSGPFDREVGRRIANLAVLYRKQRRVAEAEPLFQRALDIAEKTAGPQSLDVADRLNSLGVLYLNNDRLTEADPLFKRSIEIAEKVLGLGHASMGIRIDNLVDAYNGQRRHAEAEQLLQSKAAATENALGQNHQGVAERFEALANFYVERDTQDQAERLYQRALAIYEKTLGADHLKVATTLGSLARLYLSSDRYDEAGLLAKRALDITERKLGRDDEMVAERQRTLGSIYTEQKRYAEAEALLTQALAATEKVRGQDHARVGELVNDMAVLYNEQGRHDDAERLYKRSLAILERAYGPDHGDVGRNSTNLGHVYYRQGRYADAEPHFKRALAIAEKSGAGPDDLELAYRLDDLASLHLAQGDQARASEYWRRSTDIMLRRIRRGSNESVVSARSLAAEISRAKEQFIGLIRSQSYLDKLYRRKADRRQGGSLVDRALEFPFEMIQWAQNSKAAASLAQMATRSAKGDAALAAITRERQDLVAEWETLDVARNKIIAVPSDDRDSAEESRIATRLAAIDARIAEIDQRLKVEFPNFAAMSRLEPLSMKEVQSLLRPDEAVLMLLDTPEYGKSPGNTYIWVVAKDYDSYAPSNLSTTKLKRVTDALRCGLDASLWDDDEKAEACRKLLKREPQRDEAGNVRLDTLPFDTKLAHDLYRNFFWSLEESIKDKHLFIVAPGPLGQLPFHLLVTESPKQGDDFRSVKWLARTNSITVLPNVSALKALRRVGKPSIASKAMVGIGNPLLDGDRAKAWEVKWAASAREKQACKDLPHVQQVASVTRSPRARRVVTRGGLADLAHLRLQVALPDTADELCTVAATLQAAAGDIWLGANATEASIKRLNAEGRLADYRVVHFATHGTLAGEIEGATEPGLILTPPANASDMDDGYLSASEVANLKLDADWVILSACNTAGAKDAEGEALSGLASAFFYAGTRALLVSHWAVASDAAVKLITETVGATSSDPRIGRAEALRQAMLSMIDKGASNETHPAYWAPFVVVGEGAAAAK
jgi:CHAT domain-containing protein/Tfp pilus assembly protein PilF